MGQSEEEKMKCGSDWILLLERAQKKIKIRLVAISK